MGASALTRENEAEIGGLWEKMGASALTWQNEAEIGGLWEKIGASALTWENEAEIGGLWENMRASAMTRENKECLCVVNTACTRTGFLSWGSFTVAGKSIQTCLLQVLPSSSLPLSPRSCQG